ncbi:hypothetical protein [Methylobacterium sp. J-068]|uniref:hypothetical protein n=1 Tax=Methylobacterium sp. J-068 TaxID=2836649 RepID=UPI001FBB62FA|nr:hypothetical protein [Methylobacterium sp. J-068]MCJ2036864.1 hypothetical protein [Methylobacterium sp. J-068]
MPRFLKYVPTSGSRGLELPIFVHEIKPFDRDPVARCKVWHDRVQPVIARDRRRADVAWNWPNIIRPMTMAVGVRRGGRLFQMTIGDEQRPAAMISLLTKERWFADRRQPATYLWFLSRAPTETLTFRDRDNAAFTPRQVGQAAFDVALTIALESAGQGRLWLHADPIGGDKLLRWYSQMTGMRTIDPGDYPKLPGDAVRGDRNNDGRYLYLDEKGAERTHRALSSYRD